MFKYQLNIPVAFFIFKRPDVTERVFEVIRQVKPKTLLVVADGPRESQPDEAEKCVASRAIIEQVDWECQIIKNYSDINLGCKQRVSSGLDWIFSNFEEAIILEDDCLPDPTFFQFCEVLLNYYRYDSRIMAISGNNFQFGKKRTQDSYYFSRYNHCWGWASWRRAWRFYDVEMKLWTAIKQGNWLQDLLGDDRAINYWKDLFDSVASDRLDTWDYQWTFACWIHNGLTILPNVNLVSNIGFNADATHTNKGSHLGNLPTEAMLFPLKHPAFVIRDTQADRLTHEIYAHKSRLAMLKALLKKATKSLT
jgi:hypothetical protein